MVKSRECGKSADSVGRNILRIVWSSSIEKTHHFSNSRAETNLRKTGGFMRTGLTKREKTTAIYFDEYGSMIEVQTHNTDLKSDWSYLRKNTRNAAARLTMTNKAG